MAPAKQEVADQANIDEFQPAKDTLGLQILYEPTGGTVLADVIAVHGLGSDSFSTWTWTCPQTKTAKLWLSDRDFLPKSAYFSQTRIMTFGYDGRAWLTAHGSSSSKRPFTFAQDLLVALRNKRVLTGSLGRPIIFIGHSLGGIVIKKAIVSAHESRSENDPYGGLYWDIYQSAKAFVFFGTPHQGSDAAVWAGYLGSISKILGISRSQAAKELETWSPALRELSTFCSGHLCRPGVSLVSFYETLPYMGVLVVNEASAAMNYEHEVIAGLNENHRSMCKFGSAESSTYRFVVETMETIVHKIKTRLEESVGEQNQTGAGKLADTLPAVPTRTPAEGSDTQQRLEGRWASFKDGTSGAGIA